MTLARLSVGLTAVAYLGFGGALLIRPRLLGEVGVAIADPAGAVELRAFYGGLELGVGLFFVAALRRPPWLRPALWLQVLSLGGVVAGRLIGLAVTPSDNLLLFALMGAETAAVALGIAALRGLHRTEEAP